MKKNNIDFAIVVEKRLGKIRKKFKKYEELNEEWEKKHADHSVSRYIHTIVKGGKGIKFESAKCYLCDSMAHRKIGTIEVRPEKYEKPKPEYKKKINPEVAGFDVLP